MLIISSLVLLVAITANANLLFYQEGEQGTLKCNGKGEVQFWFLHGRGMAIRIDSNSDDGVIMNNDGTLTIPTVSVEEHDGNHVCVTKYENQFKAYSVTMNVKPLPPSNLWEAQYKSMFITGLLSALVCLVLVLGACLVYKHRYIPPALIRIPDNHLVKNSYDNPGMSSDEFSVRM